MAKEKGESLTRSNWDAAAITAARKEKQEGSQANEKDEDIFLHEEMPVEMSENTEAEDAPEKEVPESEAEDAAISRGTQRGGCRFRTGKLMGEDLVADYTRPRTVKRRSLWMMMVCQRIRLLSMMMMMMIQRMKSTSTAAEDEIIIDGDDEKDEVIPETKRTDG